MILLQFDWAVMGLSSDIASPNSARLEKLETRILGGIISNEFISQLLIKRCNHTHIHTQHRTPAIIISRPLINYPLKAHVMRLRRRISANFCRVIAGERSCRGILSAGRIGGITNNQSAAN